jgi:hypothetical protein
MADQYAYLLGFYKPSKELVKRLLLAREENRLDRGTIDRLSDDELTTLRLDVAQHVYTRMASLARDVTEEHKATRQNAPLVMSKAIGQRLIYRLMLGLGIDANNTVVIKRLMLEYFTWLYDQPEHAYTFPWGTMAFDGKVVTFVNVNMPYYPTGGNTRDTIVL